MTTPLIDERALLKLLDCTATYANIERLQQGAIMALIDCYDREITREAFVLAARTTANMIDALARLALLHNVKQFAEKHGKAEPADIALAQKGVNEMLEEANKATIEMVELMRQCPLDEDRVH